MAGPVSRAARPFGGVTHVIHATRSRGGEFVMLCHKRFAQVLETPGPGRDPNMCAKCRALDDPFNLHKVPRDPSSWASTVASCMHKTAPSAKTALLNRDLITEDGVVTPRGEVLARDLVEPTPWVDINGMVHARAPATRAHGICGATNLIIEDMSYEKLRRLHAAYADEAVSCMACVALGGRVP